MWRKRPDLDDVPLPALPRYEPRRCGCHYGPLEWCILMATSSRYLTFQPLRSCPHPAWCREKHRPLMDYPCNVEAWNVIWKGMGVHWTILLQSRPPPFWENSRWCNKKGIRQVFCCYPPSEGGQQQNETPRSWNSWKWKSNSSTYYSFWSWCQLLYLLLH